MQGLVALVMFATPNNGRALMGKLKFYDSVEKSWVEFQAFAKKFNKTYNSFQEIQQRYNIFHDNYCWIKIQNQRNMITRLAVNHFTDLNQRRILKDLLRIQGYLNRAQNYIYEYVQNVSDSLDWELKEALTFVKDQNQFKSCCTFIAVGSWEGAYFIKTGQLVSFSEQQLIDCSNSFCNQGCNGGWMDSAFQYWQQNSEETESDFHTLVKTEAASMTHPKLLPFQLALQMFPLMKLL